jgi:hypothetical protein
MVNSSLIGNRAERGGTGGGLDCSGSTVLLENCTVKENVASYGAGMFLGGSNGLIIRTVVAGNFGGSAVECWDNDYATDSSPVFVNCIIALNSGTGVYAEFSGPRFINCTISGNGSGGIDMFDWGWRAFPLTIHNSIVSGNGGLDIDGQLYDAPGIPVVANYSCYWGVVLTGIGSIIADPHFVDVARGDYRLQPSSPCIDTATSINAPPRDIEGNPRPVDIPGVGRDGPDAYDMGAYEYQPKTSQATNLWILYGTGRVETLPSRSR